MNGNRASRPSDARRKALNDELSVPSVSNFFPIENYYAAADKVHASFQAALLKKQNALDDAYIYGKRYCKFCIEAIPEHNYYSSVKYRSLQVKHTRQVEQVLAQLEQVALYMDQQEVERVRLQGIQMQREKNERARAEQASYQELQQRAQRQMLKRQIPAPVSSTNLEASALSKLALLSKPSETEIRRDPSGEEPKGQPSSRYRLTWDDEESSDDEGTTGGGTLPPPMLPPLPASPAASPAPPSYNQALTSRHFLGPGQVQPATNGAPVFSSTPPPPLPSAPVRTPQPAAPPPRKKKHPPMNILQQQFAQEYTRHIRNGRIQVLPLATYQGRKMESTNGCTVISALVAAGHLNEAGSISDGRISQVIDRECGPVLREIRGKLGLGGSALIIPSDVHDHLVDHKILKQEYFVGAAGGNVMDQQHFGEFVKLLTVGEDGKGANKKAAATLFFREHVISIVKSPVGPNQSFYDLVDSLPGTGGGNAASRTRCKDEDSLEVLLRWYTSRKFSDKNCSYIDRNVWDDTMADFDPRVFQGFVWAVSKQ